MQKRFSDEKRAEKKYWDTWKFLYNEFGDLIRHKSRHLFLMTDDILILLQKTSFFYLTITKICTKFVNLEVY